MHSIALSLLVLDILCSSNITRSIDIRLQLLVKEKEYVVFFIYNICKKKSKMYTQRNWFCQRELYSNDSKTRKKQKSSLLFCLDLINEKEIEACCIVQQQEEHHIDQLEEHYNPS
jgi:hypothetical protein